MCMAMHARVQNCRLTILFLWCCLFRAARQIGLCCDCESATHALLLYSAVVVFFLFFLSFFRRLIPEVARSIVTKFWHSVRRWPEVVRNVGPLDPLPPPKKKKWRPNNIEIWGTFWTTSQLDREYMGPFKNYVTWKGSGVTECDTLRQGEGGSLKRSYINFISPKWQHNQMSHSQIFNPCSRSVRHLVYLLTYSLFIIPFIIVL